MTTTFPNPEYTRMRLLGRRRLLVPCRRPQCRAAIGVDCTSGAYQNSAVRHVVRDRDVKALGLSDDEIVARLQGILFPGRAAQVEACQQQIDALTDDQIRESQASTRAGWVRAGVAAGADFRLHRVTTEARKPLGPIRDVAPVVDINVARRRRLRRGGPTSGGAA